MSCQTMSR